MSQGGQGSGPTKATATTRPLGQHVSSEFSLARVYREHLGRDPRRERLFLASLGFFGGFAAARAITHAILHQRGPFKNLSIGGRHLHHLVFGIGGLLGVGYLWLGLFGISSKSKGMSQATAVGYGVASAMTLDEFALWLNLQDVYWAKQGRQSIDAVAVFGGLLSIGFWGGPFFFGIGRELRKLVR